MLEGYSINQLSTVRIEFSKGDIVIVMISTQSEGFIFDVYSQGKFLTSRNTIEDCKGVLGENC